MDNPKFTPYFNDCIGALDGIYIAAYVLASYKTNAVDINSFGYSYISSFYKV
jgi:hypothetical protein